MSIMILIKLLHVLTGIWFISGLLGRWLALDRAAKATDVRNVDTLAIPGSIVASALRRTA